MDIDLPAATGPGDEPTQAFMDDSDDETDEEQAKATLGFSAIHCDVEVLQDAIREVLLLGLDLSAAIFNKAGEVDTSDPPNSHYTVLYLVTARHSEEPNKLKAVLDAGADVDVGYVGLPGKEGNVTPLRLAIDLGDIGAVRTLKRYGANPNIVGRKFTTGEDEEPVLATGTAVHAAAMREDSTFMKALYKRGPGEPPSPNIISTELGGERTTALDIALCFDAKETARVLHHHNARTNLHHDERSALQRIMEIIQKRIEAKHDIGKKPRAPPSVVRTHGRSFGRG